MHSQPSRRGLVALFGASALLLAACGDDATVDNSQESSSVPSVATTTAKPSESGSAKDDEDSKDSRGAGDARDGGAAGAPSDGGVAEVDEIPATAQRTKEDEKYLTLLQNEGLDISEVGDSGRTGGLEDQIIGAGHSYCEADAKGQESVFLAVAAGQLTAQGIYKGEPQEAERIMREAAKKAYCS